MSDGLPMHLIYAPEGLKLVSIYLGNVVSIAFRNLITFACQSQKTQTFIAPLRIPNVYIYRCVALKARENAGQMSSGFVGKAVPFFASQSQK